MGKMKDGLFQQPGSRFWYVQYRLNGRTVRESTKCVRLEDARRFRDERRAAIGRGTHIPSARSVTYEQLKKLFENAATAKGNRSRPVWAHLDTAFAGTLALDMDVHAFEAARLKAGAARASVNNDLAALRRMFRLAIEHRLLSHDQCPVIHTPDPKNARKGFVTDKQMQAIRDALSPELRGVWDFLFLTGWRVGEVLALTWRQNIDWRAGVVRLEDSKNGEPREFPFSGYPALKGLLEHQLATGERYSAERVFHNKGRRIPYETFNDARERACTATGVKALAHDLRRTAVRNMERAGISRSVAMSLSGHKTESMYRRYAIVDSSAQREGVAKLASAPAWPAQESEATANAPRIIEVKRAATA